MAKTFTHGDQIPVVTCDCGALTQVLSIPADDQGKPKEPLTHECQACGKVREISLSDIRIATAHRKQ